MKQGSILGEIGWLVYFLVIFAILMYALNVFLVPHHFNDKIADVLAGFIAALVLIGTRAYVMKRSR